MLDNCFIFTQLNVRLLNAQLNSQSLQFLLIRYNDHHSKVLEGISV